MACGQQGLERRKRTGAGADALGLIPSWWKKTAKDMPSSAFRKVDAGPIRTAL
jgi:hypothetical protein